MTHQQMIDQVDMEYGGSAGHTLEITGTYLVHHANIITYSVKRAPQVDDGRTVITHHVMVSGNSGHNFEGIVNRYEQ